MATGVSPCIHDGNALVLMAMARTAKLPPTKPVGTNLSHEVVVALEEAVESRGVSKRTLFEIALRRELGLPDYPGLPDPDQEVLKLPA